MTGHEAVWLAGVTGQIRVLCETPHTPVWGVYFLPVCLTVAQPSAAAKPWDAKNAGRIWIMWSFQRMPNKEGPKRSCFINAYHGSSWRLAADVVCLGFA